MKPFRRVGTLARRSTSFFGTRPSTPSREPSEAGTLSRLASTSPSSASVNQPATEAGSASSSPPVPPAPIASAEPASAPAPERSASAPALERSEERSTDQSSESASSTTRAQSTAPPQSAEPAPAAEPTPFAEPIPAPELEVSDAPAAVQPSTAEEVVAPEEPKPIVLQEEPVQDAPPAAEASEEEPKPVAAASEPELPQSESPLTLSVRSSREALRQELSPIEEEHRTSIYAMPPPSTAGIPSDPPPNDPPPPWADRIEMPTAETFTNYDDEGATPRAEMPEPDVLQVPRHQPSVDLAKGKEKEQVDGYLPAAPYNAPVEDQTAFPKSEPIAAPYNAPVGGQTAFPKSEPIAIPRAADQRSIRTEASGFPFFVEDPFRDPEYPTGAPEPFVPNHMPEPSTSMPSHYDQQAPREVPHEDSHEDDIPPPVMVPLPPLHEVTSARVVRNMHSDYTLTARSSKAPSVHEIETDETLPLLARTPSAQADNIVNAIWPTSATKLDTLGWTEHILPDMRTYYTHNRTRVITDADLRSPKKLQAVTAYLEKRLPEEVGFPPAGWELWLRDTGATSYDFVPVRNWVDHGARTLSFDPPRSEAGGLTDGAAKDDRLDLEYRYWSFMESHPAHAPLPPNAHTDALDALTWSYTGNVHTDHLLKSHPPAYLPFKPDESQRLMAVLHSLESADSSIQSLVHTRVVSRILLRVAHWRQQHFRPDRPLPHDTANSFTGEQHRPARRTTMDFVLAWMCFGIPYFFANRHGYQRFDEESGIRTVGPMLVFGASICLVAAIVLSASVTFLALPGLDNIARTAGFVAIVGSAASLGSSVIAFCRQQTELQRMPMRGEGLVVSTRGSILLSLPAVFLTWSVLAFVTGVVLYAFRGVAVGNPGQWTDRFAEYTRWTAVGVLGFSAGVLITSMFFVRR